MMSTDMHLIDSADICERLVGISPIYLQNFVQRNSYGLRASIQPGKVREQRRFFSRDDVFGIALVWLLFESGLRSEPLARVLNDIANTKNANANLAAKKLLERHAEYLVIARQPRPPSKTTTKQPVQAMKIVGQREKLELFGNGIDLDFLKILIPVGHKFRDIQQRLEILFPERRA